MILTMACAPVCWILNRCGRPRLPGRYSQKIIEHYPGVARGRLINEAVRELIGVMVDDLLAETRRRVQRERVFDAAHVRELGRPLIAFSTGIEEAHCGAQGLFAHTCVPAL